MIENIKAKIIPKKIICFIIMINPVVEIIYSILYRLNFNLPINQFFRIVGFLIFLAFIKKKKTRKILVLVGGIYGLIWILQIVAGLSIVSFRECVFIVKIIYTTSLIFVFQDFIECNTVETESLIKATMVSIVIIIVSVCVSPLGLGYEAWKDNDYRTGYVGLFLFSNYLTVVLLIAAGLMFSSKVIEYKKKAVFTCFIFMALILLGNKAGLVGALIYTVGLGLWQVCMILKGKKKKLLVMIMLITVLVIFAGIIFMRKYVENQIQLYKAYKYTNIWSFLLSNRDLQISYIKKYVTEMHYNKYLSLFVGYGYTNINTAMKSKWTWMNFIEMDFYALRYYLGCIPVLIWTYIDTKLVYTSIKRVYKMRDIHSFSLCIGILIAIFHSLFTGHVIFESLTIMYFAILGAIILCSNTKQAHSNLLEDRTLERGANENNNANAL
nr:O-antigen ligase family protein [uncultured Acetatifactor sp.]